MELHIRNDRQNLHVMEYALSKLDVRTSGSRLTGAMTFAVGGPVGAIVAMIFGIVVGTYSSFFVAAPVLMWLGVKRGEEAEPLKPQDARP